MRIFGNRKVQIQFSDVDLMDRSRPITKTFRIGEAIFSILMSFPQQASLDSEWRYREAQTLESAVWGWVFKSNLKHADVILEGTFHRAEDWDRDEGVKIRVKAARNITLLFFGERSQLPFTMREVLNG